MGNFNPNYFDRKSGSLERAVLDAVNGVRTQVNEKKMDAVGKEDGDIDNDGDKDASDKYLAKRRKTIAKAMKSEAIGKDIAKKMMGNKTMKSFASKVAKMKNVTQGDLEKMLPDYVAGGDIAKLFEADDFKPHMMYDPKTGKGYEAKTMEDHLRMKKMGYDHKKPKMENYDVGTPENTKAKLDATPGQSSDEWNQQVEIMQKKHTSMREALAKVWGFDEGKNPFEKNIDEKKEMGFKVEFGKGDDAGMAVYRDKKDAEAFAKRQPKPIKITKGMYDRFDEEDKTLTGKPMTKVSVDPDMKEKKN